MRIILQRLLPFFLLLFLCVPFFFIPRLELMVLINQTRTPLLDLFFSKISALGNAITVTFTVFLVLRFKLKWTAIFLTAFLIQVVLVLLFKKGFYAGELRPYLYFKMNDLLDSVSMINGLKMRYVNSFPSGHASTIFFQVSFFALLARNRVASWVLVIVGALVGFSRIYLFQHWFSDVFFGMLMGMVSTIFAYLLIKRFPKTWHAKTIQLNLQGILKETQHIVRQLFKL